MSIKREELDHLIQELSLTELSKKETCSFEENRLLSRLKTLGSRLWVDSGDLEKAKKLWKKELSALTTNNTLANQVVQTGIMDKEIKRAAERIKEKAPQISERELIFELGFIINCKIALRLVNAFQVKVSVELHPALANDQEKSILYAKRYYRVCPEYFIIKIPLTPEGYLAVRKLTQTGIPINFTLGFSARQDYLAARLSQPDYVNIFLGRLNAVVADNYLGDGEYVGEAVTLAAQKALTELRKNDPGLKTRLIAASIRNGKQVVRLAGVDVLTIPPRAVEDLLASGIDPKSIENSRERIYKPGINEQDIKRFKILWEVDDQFKEFVDTLLKMNLDNLKGKELMDTCEAKEINLFHPFSETELKQIKRQGKIPKLRDWKEDIALDNLMTVFALQSFAADQEALDSRIKRLANCS